MDGTELVSSLFPVQICTNEIVFGKEVPPWDSFKSSIVFMDIPLPYLEPSINDIHTEGRGLKNCPNLRLI